MKTKCKKMLSLVAACVCSAFAVAQTIDWNLLTTVGEEDGTISTVVDGRYEFTSERYVLDGPVSNFKFVFKDNYSPNGANGNDWNGYPWVSISEFYIYDGEGNAIDLAASCFATNAQEMNEGPMVNICDDNKTTFWHSMWSSGASDYHYLEVTLPAGITLSKFSFGWVTRYTTQGNPKTVEVYCPVPMSADAQLVILNDTRTSALAYVETLESLGLTKMKELFEQDYEATNDIDETSSEAIAEEIYRLEALVAATQAGIDAYNELGTLITECEGLVEQQASVNLSNSIAATKAVFNNVATATSGDFVAAHKALVSARNLYRIENISTASFNFSTTVTIGDWNLSLDKTNNVVRVNRYNGTETDVVIPETFTYNEVEYVTVGLTGNYPTTWYYNYNNGHYHLKSVVLPATLRFLGGNAFNYCRGLEEVQIPSSVETIGDYAFHACSSLNSIIIPNNVTYIGEYAFANCTNLSDVHLSDSLQIIYNYAFSGCASLENITIPANVHTIGNYVFNNCTKLKSLRCDAPTPPSCSNDFNTNTLVVYVPTSSGAEYEAAAYWKNRIIIDGEGVSASVDVETPGTLGEKLLEQVEYLRQVNYLTVSGTLNDDDLYNIQNRMTGLLAIDMSKVNMTALPNNMFDYRYALQQVVLPENLESIGKYAFRDCYNLQDVTLPATLKSISINAFEDCDNFKHVVIPEGVTTVGTYAFHGCNALQTVEWPSTATTISDYAFYQSGIEFIKIPEGVTTIGTSTFAQTNLRELECPSTLININGYAFSNCALLSAVSFNEGLQSLSRSFDNCDALTEIVLPSTLNYCYESFDNCNKINSIICLALLPPHLEYNRDILYNVNKENCILYVPEWTINNYKLTIGWDAFPTIEPIKGYFPQNINVSSIANLTLPDSIPTDYKPNLALDYFESVWNYGALTLNGDGMLSIDKYHMVYDLNVAYDHYYNGDTKAYYNSLVNNANMRADSVGITSYFHNNVWAFLSFPYDVKVSDIISLYDNTNFVIRKYSGKDRAVQNLGNTWQDMTVDSILHAGEGYIWQCNRYEHTYSGFYIPAMNNTNKNLIFANNNRTIALNEYQSEFSHNRSWNLIGNPYPCFYDTRAMDFTAPITVWSMYNNCYYAYSPIDDEYILSPGEAFFVQRPVDAESITFAANGRQTDRVVRDRAAQAKAYTRGVTTRQVFNLTLSDGEMTDRTRFVINPDAACDYDMSSDATKFMSSDARAAQLYTIEGAVQFAINERPMGNGVITLGAHFGSQGSYTIAMDTKVKGMSAVLVDKVAGTETDLTESAYTFTAEAGVADNRFEVRMRAYEENGDATGMNNLSGKVSVKATSGQIVVTAPCESAIEIYNAEGQRIATATAASATFEVAQGVYVVKVQDTVHKVSVTR